MSKVIMKCPKCGSLDVEEVDNPSEARESLTAYLECEECEESFTAGYVLTEIT